MVGGQYFSNLSVHTFTWGSCSMRILTLLVWGGAWDSAFFIKSPWTAISLVQDDPALLILALSVGSCVNLDIFSIILRNLGFPLFNVRLCAYPHVCTLLKSKNLTWEFQRIKGQSPGSLNWNIYLKSSSELTRKHLRVFLQIISVNSTNLYWFPFR